MFMPMVWTDDFDDMDDYFDSFHDPFDDVISLVDAAPTKDEIETEKSIGRHAKKEARRYGRDLRRRMNQMNQYFTQNAMKTDVVDNGDHFTVTADLPGFDKKDINIGLKNGILTVSASHKEEKGDKDEKTGRYVRHERTESSYQRSFNVGEDVKPEEIHAKYENGVLTLTVPNKAAAIEKKEDTKQIEVQ